MSEKVKLKRKHADLIESELGKMSKSDLMNQHVRTIVEKNNRFVGDYAPFNSLSIEDMAKALYIGYEVEEEWKIGDWVVYKNEYHTCVMKVIGVSGDFIDVEPYHEGFKELNRICVRSPLIRHATEQEIAQEKNRRFWDELDRDVDEYKIDDLVKFKVVDDVGYVVSEEEFGTYEIYFYKNDKFITLHKSDIKLITRAEDRLDQ